MKNLEEEIEEMYGTIDCEGEFFPDDNFVYRFVMGDESGWNVYVVDMNDETQKDATDTYCDVCPFEHFKSKAELISNFRLRKDGRTILEYICDECGAPRLLVAPPSKIYHQEGSKYN